MSFSTNYAGPADQYIRKLEAGRPGPDQVKDALSYGGTLGDLTREYLQKVAELAGNQSVIVEASGHADGMGSGRAVVQVNVRFLTAQQT